MIHLCKFVKVLSIVFDILFKSVFQIVRCGRYALYKCIIGGTGIGVKGRGYYVVGEAAALMACAKEGAEKLCPGLPLSKMTPRVEPVLAFS